MMIDNSTRSKDAKFRFQGLWQRGGILQLIFVTVLPLTVLLLAITLASISAHQRAMRTMVGERDERAVKTAAAALETLLTRQMASIQGLAQLISSEPQESLGELLNQAGHLMSDFDGGLAIVDEDGNLLAAVGDRAVWQALAGDSGRAGKQFSPTDPAQVHVSDAFPSPAGEGLLVVISNAASRPGDAESIIRVMGAFSPGELALGALGSAFPVDSHSTVLLFDRSKQLLYQSGHLPVEGSLPDHMGIAEALAGQSGTSFIPTPLGEHVVAFTPVKPSNWALVVEEPWEMVASPMLSYTQMAPLVLVPVLLFTLFALWFGVRQIVQPLQALEEQADALAWGNYQAIKKPVGGINEIRRLQNGLIHMAQKVQTAQQGLHGYIGAITAGQEEERRRLARELHDDTIQSLIALKQRVQLAQLKPPNGTSAQPFSELEELTEKTIDNLRRVTRALRPIYLEDLGLLAALEMLTREVAQVAEIPVEFTASGTEQRLPPKVELALYRIAQEALSNVTRHALATQAAVNLKFEPGMVVLEVADNGKGFEVPASPAEFAPSGHYGLLGLYERAELIEADLAIESKINHGTRLVVRLMKNS